MKGSGFTVLCLSDSHIGKPGRGSDVHMVFDPLLKDLRDAKQKNELQPNLVVFLGDLAFSGKQKEYEDVRAFLDQVHSCFSLKLGDIPILMVPGNHDCDRDVIDEAHRMFRKELSAERAEGIFKRRDKTLTNILERQDAWRDFVRSIPNQPWKWDDTINICTGILEWNGSKVGLVGFNSSWISQDDDDRGRLRVGEAQYQDAYLAVRSADLRIAVSHHPIDWLHEDERNLIEQKVETQFNVFLHGHEHKQWFIDSVGHLKCSVGACYEGTKNKNGITWLKFDLAKKSAEIRLREYSNEGVGGWRANHILGKTDEHGEASLSFLRVPDDGKGVHPCPTPALVEDSAATPAFPTTIQPFVKILEERFRFRWERGNLPSASQSSVVYWPVRLRHPAPIHAAQCFVAAGLVKVGSRIELWIDDLGTKEYSVEHFVEAMKNWFTKAGGSAAQLSVMKFSEIVKEDGSAGEHADKAWQMLQKWLGTMAYYTDSTLRISKIWPATEDPQAVVEEMQKRRPRRLMTPSMVWTCLSVLHEREPSTPIITLGGYDEQGLWSAWRSCCDMPALQIGHIYVPKLTEQKKSSSGEQAIHLVSKPLDWQSREDIEKEFQLAVSEDDSTKTWSNVQGMIPWTINNCVLLPSFVAGTACPVMIGQVPVHSLDDLHSTTPSQAMQDLIAVASAWLL